MGRCVPVGPEGSGKARSTGGAAHPHRTGTGGTGSIGRRGGVRGMRNPKRKRGICRRILRSALPSGAVRDPGRDLARVGAGHRHTTRTGATGARRYADPTAARLRSRRVRVRVPFRRGDLVVARFHLRGA